MAKVFLRQREAHGPSDFKDKHALTFELLHIFINADIPSTYFIFALLHAYMNTHIVQTHAAREDHSVSIHEKSGLSSCSQPNLAARSPSALPSAGLSAACLEVNSFMIPLSVLPIFKWLILPLWQPLAGPVARRPASLFQHHSGHREDNYPQLFADMWYQRIDFIKHAVTTTWHICRLLKWIFILRIIEFIPGLLFLPEHY